MAWRFKEYDSTERGTLCHLFDDDGQGAWLGSVWVDDLGRWTWETPDWDPDDPDDDSGGVCETRREAKGALRRYLRENPPD